DCRFLESMGPLAVLRLDHHPLSLVLPPARFCNYRRVNELLRIRCVCTDPRDAIGIFDWPRKADEICRRFESQTTTTMRVCIMGKHQWVISNFREAANTNFLFQHSA